MLTGCRSRQVHDLRSQYLRGNLGAAESASVKLLEKPKGDANVVRLDQAVVQLLDGRPAEAEQNLRLVRDQFDHLKQKSLTEDVVSLGTDDTQRAYSGEDYERVLIRVFLSLSSLFTDSADAAAYALQVVDEQQQIIATHESGSDTAPPFKRVAIGPYLRAAILEERFTESSDVRRSRLQVVEWEPGFEAGHVDHARAAQGNHSSPGHGVLYVVALVGQGPHKVQTSARPTSEALLIADQILSRTGKYTLPPTVAPVPIAAVVRQAAGPASINLLSSGRVVGQTETITNVGQLAEQQFAANRPAIVARAVVRRIAKKGMVVAMKKELGVERNNIADIALTVGGMAWEATEKADLRCWDLLPDRIQVLRIELPAGEHQLALQPTLTNAVVGQATEQVRVPIRDGRNTWMLASFPNDRLVGKVLVR
jgi:hypothetical protein